MQHTSHAIKGYDSTRLWDDLMFLGGVRSINESVVELVVYEIIGWSEDGFALFGNFNTKYDTYPEITHPYLTGTIKWDGCSDWHFVEQDEVELHFCGRKQAVRIGQLFDNLYTLAEGSLTPSLDPKLYEGT